ncbi:MAG: hypothetical protein CVT99_04950 [Bacteroidetes bacterium HGW-Bacteroidetes-16]|nr:MAG: hypothetical protein CVT99_04950 [Bacteroidetes bacterium HGW-Bacteroidetes-16]
MTEKDHKSNLYSSISLGQLTELRKAITGLDSEDLQRLSRLIQDPELFSIEISQLLPLSIKKMFERGEVDEEQLRKFVEQVLHQSVKSDPGVMATILFPIMMPAIRKAVAEDIKRMVESLNTTLEYGFSPKRIGWRMQALFSGRKYAEIVLSNAYVFKVSQVFLIHRTTGLLLNQVQETEIKDARNADMVSSMMSAIKDFVQDSFQRDAEENLDSIKVGNFNIWIEQGPYAIIAAIVEGNVPGSLRLILKEAIEAIHVNFSYELEHFQGDTEPFVLKDRFLRTCLLNEKKEIKRKKPVIIFILVALLLGVLGFWTYTRVETKLRFNRMLDELEATKGVVVTGTEKKDGVYSITGLYDPLVSNLNNVVKLHGFDLHDVKLNLEPMISLDYDLVLLRARRVLMPPETIDLSLKRDTLIAEGAADNEWLERATSLVLHLPGIYFFDIAKVNEEKMQQTPARQLVEKRILAIENYYFVFRINEVKLDSLQKIDFDILINEAKSVLNFRFDQDSVPVIEVYSHTSRNGHIDANKNAARLRAEKFVDLMLQSGLPIETLVPKVIFVEDEKVPFPVRSVSFKVKYVNPAAL